MRSLHHPAAHYNALQQLTATNGKMTHLPAEFEIVPATATQCNTLQHTATHGSMIHLPVKFDTVLATHARTATHCNTLQHTAS